VLEFEYITILGTLLVFFGVYMYVKENEEFPLIIAIFNYSICISRFKLIQSGIIKYVHVNYRVINFHLDDDKAIIAMNYILLGSVAFILFYLYFKRNYSEKKIETIDTKNQLSEFLLLSQKHIIIGFFVFFIVASAMRASIQGALALGNGYAFLIGMGVGGFNLLIGLQLFNGNLKRNHKIIMGILLFIGIVNSYNPTSRFQFLSWAIGITYILFKDMKPSRKLKFILPIGIGVMLFFSLLGADRNTDLKSHSFKENFEIAIERTLNNEDQNMLDGFMMVLDVYPQYLDFSYGMEHLEVLMRPIPRSIWPNKPLGGYVNKLGLTNIEKHGTVGISQTIYGSFYGEGGVIGIIIFSIIYAKLIAWLLSLAKKYDSDIKYLIKGVVVASFIPLIRGGDLPGIYAFIGMSFWPVFLFLKYYNKFLKNYVDSEDKQVSLSKDIYTKG
jgi:oligosaccharide repeat unit polymerase